MTIISKLDKAKGLYVDTLIQLREALTTQRNNAATRNELAAAKARSIETGICPYCRESINVRSLRHVEACEQCGKAIDRMLQLKSGILAGTEHVGALEQLHELYSKLQHVPPALRGRSDDVATIVCLINTALNAEAIYRRERKAASAREASVYVANRRREEILDMLIRCGADKDSDETKQQVEEIYWDRYGSKE